MYKRKMSGQIKLMKELLLKVRNRQRAVRKQPSGEVFLREWEFSWFGLGKRGETEAKNLTQQHANYLYLLCFTFS
jgi:hypothetical protein